MLPIPSLLLGTSLLTASYGFFGNLGGSMTGVLPLIQGGLGAYELSAKQRLRAWVLQFSAGHV
jgi:hypothetical protein